MATTEQHLFSTGILAVTPALTPLAAYRHNSLTQINTAVPTVITGPYAEIIFDQDPNVDGTVTWLIIDLGVWQSVGALQLFEVYDNGSTGVAAYMSDDATLTPGVAGTMSLGTSSAVGTTPGTVSFAPLAPISGRYVLVTGVHQDVFSHFYLAGVNVIGASIPFAVVQEMTIDIAWAAKELYTDAQDSVFPIDVGFDEAKMSMKASNCGIRADALQLLLKSQLSGGSVLTNTLPTAVTLPPCRLTFTGQDTLGISVACTINNAYTKGASLPFRLNDFVMQGFEFQALRDSNGNIGSISIQVTGSGASGGLPSQIIVGTDGGSGTNAGTAGVDGTYLPVSDGVHNMFNGATQYTNGTYFIFSNIESGWAMTSAAEPGGAAYVMYLTPDGTPTSFPTLGWTAIEGDPPAPTVTAVYL